MSREPEAGTGTYLLRQTFRYDYASPVRRLRHRLIVVPRPVHGGQRLVDHEVSVRGAASSVSAHDDAFGNRVLDVRADRVTESIEFDLWALVHRDGPGRGTPVGADAGAGAGLGRLTSAFATATALTEADPFLREVAADLAAGAGSGLVLAERACSWTRAALGYQHDVTTVRTTAAEAVAGGKGVCQDYAHVMLALCRAAGLPARYVSGHLVGEGGSHAWVEVIPGDGGMAVAFDPTHDRRAHGGYVTVAVGRDYADVAPTSGRFHGEGPGRLTATKTLALVDAASVLI